MNKQNEKSHEKKLKDLVDFDPDFLPFHSSNKKAAEQRGLVYDSSQRAYIDEDDYLIKDKFGQPF